jgi:hypothetical protein
MLKWVIIKNPESVVYFCAENYPVQMLFGIGGLGMVSAILNG